MSFLQPLFLAALPLISLPVIIHLINQRRYQTVRWGAMMFLLAANRMSRGYARLRQWLILLFRVLAVLGLVLALTRPLASGRVGLLMGGQADTTIVLLDRSPSMRQLGAATGDSKLSAGVDKLSSTLAKLGSTRWVLVDSAAGVAREIESPSTLRELPEAAPVDTSADIPTMLELARDYIEENRVGRTEIWICSDAREFDWRETSGQWQALRDSFAAFPQGVRFHLLAYAEEAPANLAIRVTSAQRRQTPEGTFLYVSLRVDRDVETEIPLTVPVVFEIEGARSEVPLELTAESYELRDHRIPLAGSQERGWGRVSIPADANPADNEYYFVFDRPVRRRAIIVGGDPRAVAPIELAASISPELDAECEAQRIDFESLPTVPLSATALVVWQGPLPTGSQAELLEAFVNRGGRLLFLPPAVATGQQFMGVRWGDWNGEPGKSMETWRGDQDLLAHSESGMALPVGGLEIRRACALEGNVTPLATLVGGELLLARLPTDQGGVYFLCTTPSPDDSSLAADGIVLYVLLQRALKAGAEALGQARQLVAGETQAMQTEEWRRVAGSGEALSTAFMHHAGVYRTEDRLLAVNRDDREDEVAVLEPSRVARLFDGLDFSRIDDRVGSLAGLVQEVWRMFLMAMMIALVVEAALCLPRSREQSRKLE